MRTCPQCGDLVEGRADKVFCSASCKSRHFRENPSSDELTPAPAIAGLATAPRPAAPRGHQVEELENDEKFDFHGQLAQGIAGIMDERKQAERAEEARTVQRQAAKLDKLYEKCARRLLDAHGQVLTENELRDFVQEMDEAYDDYREHPHIEERGHAAGVRMLIFGSMRNYLAELLQELEAMPARGLFGGLKNREIGVDLAKKYRRQVRESLPDALQ